MVDTSLFDMGKQGEDKYKGKVVLTGGIVDVEAARPAPGGGQTITMRGHEHEPPYVSATIDEESVETLRKSEWRPRVWVVLEGVYRERDARGTVVLEGAQIRKLMEVPASYRVRPNKLAPKLVVVSAEELAQGLCDNLAVNHQRYHNAPLQITGVVHQRVEKDGEITKLVFQPMIVEAKTGKAVEFGVSFLMKPAVPVAEAAGLAEGKKVTIRGMISTCSNRHAALHYGEVVRE